MTPKQANKATPISPSSNYTTTLEVDSQQAEPHQLANHEAAIQALTVALDQILLGKTHKIRLALACLLARGHLLIEDLPGMGKTLLSHALALVLGLSYNRVQFTSDVFPADILGTSIFDRETGAFRFVEGPLFAQVVLADEINRTPPKTQAALLQSMQEQRVTAGGHTYPLEPPFHVFATQNPIEQEGT